MSPKPARRTVQLVDVAFEFEPGIWTLDDLMRKLGGLDGCLKAKVNGLVEHPEQEGGS